ncbi:CHAT domain-containing tetratricopeptide repeat protein [Calothrix sp. PCC 6303]|uniref:CHAT domain-containing tetratricopeptide repeat protein n=1 Tax=Calothrix sp. PCC 6303 TaxID=1170562 RepID=UPI0002A04611|nr:tetratricopeptide repeat protein [Calothrix sp. PCC 6303]AFZ00374.1 Tetratricopeptide TPR_1 repeat-containing protein [Calothrix sp. PCC 6303]
MAQCKKNRVILSYLLPKFSHYSLIALLSVVLVSESVGARATLAQLQIAQQPATTQPDATRAEAEKLTKEGLELYKQGTAESLIAARKKLEQALVLWQKLDDKKWQALTLLGIGGVYSDLGDKQEALKFYNQSLSLSIEVGNKQLEATTLNNIGGVYSDLGDKQQALKFYNQSLPLRIEVGDKSGQATTLNNSGLVYYSLGDKQQALKFYNQSLPLYVEVGNKSGQAVTLNNIGAVYSDLGDKQQALKFYNQSLPLRIEVGDKSGQATTLNNIGEVYFSLGDKQQALKFYNQSLPLTIEVEDKSGQATTLNNIGLVYDSLGEKTKALKFFNQSLPLTIEVEDKSGQAKILANLADLERKQGNLEASLKQIDAAIEIIEELRKTYTNKELQTTYFASVQNFYQFKTSLLMELHKRNPSKGYDSQALNNNERSRARVLIDLLAESGANIRKGVNPQLLAEEQRLQQLLNAKEKARTNIISTTKDSDTAAKATAKQLEEEIAEIISQQETLKAEIRQKSPQYDALQYPQPLELKGIQQQLDKDTILLQYSLGEERSYLWLVTPDSLQAYELPKGEEIEKAVTNFRDVMDKFVKRGDNYKPQEHPNDINQPALQLSQLVLAPVANKLGNKRLVIVADGGLQTIPFAALADPGTPPPAPPGLQGGEKDQTKPQNLSPQQGREESKPLSALQRGSYQPLLVNHEIVNLPSVTAIQTQRKLLNNRPLSPKTLAVLADPVFSAEQAQGKPESWGIEVDVHRSAQQRAMKNLNRSGLIPLPGTRIEAKAMLKLLPSEQTTYAFGADANYEFATNPTLKQYQHLFFATHGLVDTKQPELSGIALTQVDKNGKPVEKSYLRLGDIFNMDWAAELVVLSACETGLGKDTKGEGLVGLTRGLMYAGSKRAVVSLWNVSDNGTSQLMPIFYKSVLAGKSPAVALREAQLQMWQGKEWRNPFYWAAFTLQGEWR